MKSEKVIRVIEVIKLRYLITLITLITLALSSSSQTGTVNLGLEYKPIFPVGFLRTGTQTASSMGIEYSVTLNSGFNGGMVIRKSFSNLLSFEVGINYVQREYTNNINDSGHTESSFFHIISYEIPASLLIYAQTGEKTFANASMGISPDMFASNWQAEGDNHRSYTVHPHFIEPALIANIGWEYRTEESGYLYIGASFHGPFNPDFTNNLFYKKNGLDLPGVAIPMSGNYLTVDFRYFFPPDNSRIKKQDQNE